MGSCFEEVSSKNHLSQLSNKLAKCLVFHINTNDISNEILDKIYRNLSGQDLLLITQIANTERKVEYAASHGALNFLLIQLTKKRIQIAVDKNGKPYSKNKDVYFNLTHSKGHILIALTTTCEIGIDVEKIHEFQEMRDVANVFFHESEIASLYNDAHQDFIFNFYRLWTRKEAVLKASGEGIASYRSAYALQKLNTNRYILNNPHDLSHQWFISDFEIHGECYGAIAMKNDIAVELYDLNFSDLDS